MNIPATSALNPTALEPVRSLYIHVPFCAHKCEYCAFYSHPANGEIINRYVAALCRELETVEMDLPPKTIFFGGGTPSMLNLKQWETVLQTMGRLNLLGAREWTVECNPATVSLDKARLLRDHGVNRISMGVQSLDEQLLDRLGRIHSREMVFKSLQILREAGFDNLNIDLMFAIPGQTMEIWRSTLAEAIALGSEHLSCYEVIYEQDTPLYEQLKAGEFSVDEELACDMYEELVNRVGGAGYGQYEVANFAQSDDASALIPTKACQHNVNYWQGGSYYGLGPSASGYLHGRRTRNWSSTNLYIEQLEKGGKGIESEETLPPLQRAAETAAFGLRMPAGWNFAQFKTVTGFDLRDHWNAEMEECITAGWAEKNADRFHLTQKGIRFADAAAEKFLR